MSVLEQPQAAETLKLMKTATWETGATFSLRRERCHICNWEDTRGSLCLGLHLKNLNSLTSWTT